MRYEQAQHSLSFRLRSGGAEWKQHIHVRSDRSKVVCMDLDSDSVEDLLVFSTTYGYLGQDQHVQIFLVKMVAHSP